MFKVDSVVLICSLIIPETSLFTFLKPLAMYVHLIVLKKIFKSKLSCKTISTDGLPQRCLFLKKIAIFKSKYFTKY